VWENDGMAYDYVSVDRDQLFMLPPSMREWIPEDHIAWFLLDVVSEVDTAPFHARHGNDGAGRGGVRPGHDVGAAALCLLHWGAVNAT